MLSAQTHEVIGSPPNISVPTHFAKVVLTSKPTSPATPDILELSLGAFVLPNAVIKDETPLEGFVMPGPSSSMIPHLFLRFLVATVEAVERAAGLTLFSDDLKANSKHICKTTKCEVIIRRFDDARKKGAQKAIAAPK